MRGTHDVATALCSPWSLSLSGMAARPCVRMHACRSASARWGCWGSWRLTIEHAGGTARQFEGMPNTIWTDL
eukprot:356243-Chlamydomonas_euryale.AAC.4